MNPYSPQEFAEAFGTVDATDEPEATRNLIDEEDRTEYLEQQKRLAEERERIMRSKSGKGYSLENGELKQVES